jgi:hypothetical protein
MDWNPAGRVPLLDDLLSHGSGQRSRGEDYNKLFTLRDVEDHGGTSVVPRFTTSVCNRSNWPWCPE